MRRRTHFRIWAAIGASLLITVAFLAATGVSANATDTATTFTVSAGALAITTPTSAAVGAGAPGTTISAALGAVTVTDARARLTASWTATASSTDFTTGGATPAETIPSSAVSYWSGAATATTGSGTFTPQQATALAAQPLSTPRAAMVMTEGVGNNSATWDPGLVVAVPAAAVGGIYTGTVTHSAA